MGGVPEPSPGGLKGSGAHSDCAREQERGTGVSKHCGFVCFLFQQSFCVKRNTVPRREMLRGHKAMD